MLKLKKLIGLAAVTLGGSFTLLALLSIWEVSVFMLYPQTIFSKLIPTLGVLTVAFMALLAVIRLMEEKNGKIGSRSDEK